MALETRTAPIKDRGRVHTAQLTPIVDNSPGGTMSVQTTINPNNGGAGFSTGNQYLDAGLNYALSRAGNGGTAFAIAQETQRRGGMGTYFPEGAQIDIQTQAEAAAGPCPPGYIPRWDKCSGTMKCVKRRSRRKKLLTCSDRGDIAFVIGQLGKGANGQAAVSALLSRCG